MAIKKDACHITDGYLKMQLHLKYDFVNNPLNIVIILARHREVKWVIPEHTAIL